MTVSGLTTALRGLVVGPSAAMRRLLLVTAIATVALTPLLLNGNIRYEVGAVRVSGFSAAETFTHRPLAFRLLSAAQSWLPEQAARLVGPTHTWNSIVVFECSFRLISALVSAGAAWLLWRGLRRHFGSQAWAYGFAAYVTLVFTAPATGEPDWMASVLAVAAVGAALMGGGLTGPLASGVLLALSALVKISSLPIAVAALVLLWALNRHRALLAAAVAFITGLLAIGLMWWLTPWEIEWLIGIRAVQKDPWVAEHAQKAWDYLMNVAARWPTVTLIPAFFVGHRLRESWTALVALLLTAFGIAYQGQYFMYHAIGLVTLASILAIHTIRRSRAALSWPLLALSLWTLVLFLLPGSWRVHHALALSIVTVSWAVVLTGWQWRSLRHQRIPRPRGAARWAAICILASMLATQTPLSAESLTLSTANRSPLVAAKALRRQIRQAERIHALIGTESRVAYLAFGDNTYTLGNPTHCRFPSQLFLQRKNADVLVAPQTRGEGLRCLSDPDAQWLLWDRDWLHRGTAPRDLIEAIDNTWDCKERGVLIGQMTVCPRAR